MWLSEPVENEIKFLNNVLIANEYHPKDVNQIISTCEHQKGDKVVPCLNCYYCCIGETS